MLSNNNGVQRLTALYSESSEVSVFLEQRIISGCPCLMIRTMCPPRGGFTVFVWGSRRNISMVLWGQNMEQWDEIQLTLKHSRRNTPTRGCKDVDACVDVPIYITRHIKSKAKQEKSTGRIDRKQVCSKSKGWFVTHSLIAGIVYLT